MRLQGSPEELERCRYQALELLKQNSDLLKLHVCSMFTVGAHPTGRPLPQGRPIDPAGSSIPGGSSRFAPMAKKELENEPIQGAKAAGFLNDLWTYPRVAQLAQKRLYFPRNRAILLIKKILPSLRNCKALWPGC